MVTIKGHEIKEIRVTNSHNRRAQGYANTIFTNLKKLGVHEDYIDLEIERACFKKAQAVVNWGQEGEALHYSYDKANNYAENLYIASKVIEAEVLAVLAEEKTVREFLSEFKEEDDVHEQRKEAREILGVAQDEKDFEVIAKQYKQLSKKHHPDMPEGSHEEFQRINKAHKILKRELQ